MSDSWDDIAAWWTDEVRDDPAYTQDIHPILLELFDGTGGLSLDLGCGEGQVMRLVGGSIIGTDLSLELLRIAVSAGPVVQARLPGLTWLKPDTFDRAFSVYLVDLIADHSSFFSDVARIVKPGGHLVVAMNHPVYTAPGSAPLMDSDGEVLWRWGTYLSEGSSLEAAGPRTIEFYHRPVGELLTAAAAAGWSLDRMIERGLSAETISRFPAYVGQEHIPRLAGFRWRRMVPEGL
ncbi:MAG: class I SAM-dependent methyltransferase [Acidimicrobiia bacterium]|nr:MAG: class I SAM-dependent methyltransferase [Acidimicrobiia bacterium]